MLGINMDIRRRSSQADSMGHGNLGFGRHVVITAIFLLSMKPVIAQEETTKQSTAVMPTITYEQCLATIFTPASSTCCTNGLLLLLENFVIWLDLMAFLAGIIVCFWPALWITRKINFFPLSWLTWTTQCVIIVNTAAAYTVIEWNREELMQILVNATGMAKCLQKYNYIKHSVNFSKDWLIELGLAGWSNFSILINWGCLLVPHVLLLILLFVALKCLKRNLRAVPGRAERLMWVLAMFFLGAVLLIYVKDLMVCLEDVTGNEKHSHKLWKMLVQMFEKALATLELGKEWIKSLWEGFDEAVRVVWETAKQFEMDDPEEDEVI